MRTAGPAVDHAQAERPRQGDDEKRAVLSLVSEGETQKPGLGFIDA
jgi:hypothetical protein